MNIKSNKNSRKKYKVKNWPEYDKALKERGDIAVWITEEAIKAWIPVPRVLRHIRVKPGSLPLS